VKIFFEKGEIRPFYWISAGFFHGAQEKNGPQLKCLLTDAHKLQRKSKNV